MHEQLALELTALKFLLWKLRLKTELTFLKAVNVTVCSGMNILYTVVLRREDIRFMYVIIQRVTYKPSAAE